MSLCIVYFFAHSFIVHLLTSNAMMHQFWGRLFAGFIAEVILCQFAMTWVHIVISEPSKLPWYKRVPRGWKSWKNIAPAAALQSAASRIVVVLPAAYVCHSKLSYFHFYPQISLSQADVKAISIDSLIVLGLYLLGVILIEIPATVTFTRVAASMLPEQNEAIVPFDRTFNGKVVPKIVGGNGKIGMVEAWRSFDRSSRLRFLKLVGKVIAIEIAINILLIGVVIGELKLTMGEDLDKMIQHMKAMGKQ
jgi:hypothetical protein